MRIEELIQQRLNVENMDFEVYSDQELERIVELCDRDLSNNITNEELKELEQLKNIGLRGGRGKHAIR